ncbi:MAG: prolipoprotein diacylglyceryl transferase, partial [Planctomycetes bacterium]|nr:prolipoprotein diacylglyceryl transferase [Planctomycetota bacterium]
VPTYTAFAVINLLELHLPDLVDYEFTAKMENGLDAIANGEREAGPWLHDFYFGEPNGKKSGKDADHISNIAIWALLLGVVGARAFHVAHNWEIYRDHPAEMFAVWSGGLEFLGGFILAIFGLVLFCRIKKRPIFKFLDILTPSLMLGLGIGRLGCFLNGCCYGAICTLPWAVQFPQETPAYVDQMEHGALYVHGLKFQGAGGVSPVIERVEPDSPAERQGLKPGEHVVAVGGVAVHSVQQAQTQLLRTFGEGHSVEIAVAGDPAIKSWTITGPPPVSRPVHPTQLYSLFDALLLCGLLLFYEPFKRRDGELTALVLTIHPVSRFLLEIIRVDESPVFGTGMSISQNISIAIFVGGVALWIYLFWWRPKEIAWAPRPAVAA